MDNALASALIALAPGAVASVFAVASFVFTQRRAERQDERTQKLDDRSAAKDTVNSLSILNKALADEIDNLRARFTEMELRHDTCERERVALLEQLMALRRSHPDRSD